MGKSPQTDLDSLLNAWRTSQRSANRSDRTIDERERNVRGLLDFTGEDPLKISPEGVERFLARRGLKPNTRSTYYASIKAFSVWLVHTERRRLDPTERVERPDRVKSRPRPISQHQLERILRVCNRRRTRMMVLLAAFAGLRVHEIAKIQGEDIDWSTGALTVVGKGGDTKIIPLDDAILDEMGDWPRRGYWFPSYKVEGEAIHGRGVSSAISSAMRRAGVHGTPHQLRHFYGTQLIDGGANLRVTQELMRHESVASTQIYTGVSFSQLRDGLRALRSAEILAAAA